MASKPVIIKAPNFQIAEFKIRGDAPYVQNAFSQKAKAEIKVKQKAGSTGRSKRTKEAKNFQESYQQAMHKTKEGWCGIPAPAFRAAMVSACRTVGFKMTVAKLSVFIEADGFDENDNTPLVKITKGEPEYFESLVRIQQTIDIRPRPMWAPGWEAILKVKFDADQFTWDDVANLLMRVGMQVGVGEGRPDSKSSTGMGWGTFKLINE